MAIDSKAIRRAMMVAKDIAASVSNVPLMRAKGGEVETVQGPQRQKNLDRFMEDAHPDMFDENGAPRKFYHGTTASNIEKFQGWRGSAGHFSFVPEFANEFANAAEEKGQQVYAVHLNVKNPFDARNPNHLKKIGKPNEFMKHWEILEENLPTIKKAGFDSYYDWEYSGENPDGIAVFHPHQIKSAVGNRGTFDHADPDITKADGGDVEGNDVETDDDYLTVYHGTPHRFAPTERSELGEFDPTKIGTGEGNQAYGHGLYFSQNPEVAKSYRKNLGVVHGKWLDKEGKEFPFSDLSRDQRLALRHLQLNHGDFDKAESSIKNWESTVGNKNYVDALHSLKDKNLAFEPSKGALYTVGLHKDAAEKMLDWDKTFSQQHPDVQKALQDAGIVGKDSWLVSGMRGKEIYGRAQFGAPAKLPLRAVDDHIFAAQRLLEAGIPGIKYLDNTSRARYGGESTHNFVVFPGAEHHLKIIKREKRGGLVTNDTKVPLLDPAKSIRRATMIAKADGGSLGGLEFPEDESAFRLRTKLNRQAKVAAGKEDPGLPSNERMIIRAPKSKKGEQQLPNFVVGPLNFADWTKRVESILTPAEIEHSAKWYRNIKGNFLNYVNGDESQANKLMRAWLVAQQNTSPATAFNNVLLQREQILRGMPEHLWKAGGMPNPTAAARSVLQDQPIRAGVGVKISDFVDSAEGKDVRSWHGNKQEGGSPFVIDVHSARDTGLVDPALLNHLRNLGYNEDDLAKAQIDFDASPSDAQYENRAQWGRDLTNHLNKKGWMGIKNWRPEEIQAVGWMGMTKLTRNAEEDSASGLGRNLRRISYELAPGEGSPWAEKYGHAFEGLPDEERYNITRKMADRALDIAHQYAGTLPMSTVHGTGAWMQYQNPAAVGQMLATQQGADIAANVIGHLLHQTEVWHNRVKPITSSPKGFAVDFIESNSKNLADRDALRDFWQKIMDSDKSGLIQGFQPITLPNGQVGVRALVDKGGTGTRDKLVKTLQEGGELDTMLKSLPFDIESQLSEAEITKARNDWKENRNGQTYLQRISDLVGSDPSASLRAHGSQLEKELQGHLDEAYARQGGSWRQSTPGAPAQAEVTPTPPQNFSSGGSIDHALRVAAKVRGYGRFS